MVSKENLPKRNLTWSGNLPKKNLLKTFRKETSLVRKPAEKKPPENLPKRNLTGPETCGKKPPENLPKRNLTGPETCRKETSRKPPEKKPHLVRSRAICLGEHGAATPFAPY